MAAPIPQSSGRLIFEKSNFLNVKSRHGQIIGDKGFNHEVFVFLPQCEHLPPAVSAVMKRQLYWQVHGLHAETLIRKEFIEAFVRRGQLNMISTETRIDVDNCMSISPKGVLWLSLGKDTFEQLGLNGKPSHFNGKIPRKFVVQVDLTEDSFIPGKKNYERVKWCLSNRLNLPKDFLFVWEPKDPEVCPSSAAAYFENNGFVVSCFKTDRRIVKSESVSCPVIQCDKIQESASNAGYQQIWEWLGIMALNIDTEGVCADSFLSTLSCPEPKERYEHAASCRLTGMLSTDRVSHICEKLRHTVKDQNLPWAMLAVQGFQDAPQTWSSWEHAYHHHGDNLYTYLIFPNDAYWLYMAVGSHDVIT